VSGSNCPFRTFEVRSSKPQYVVCLLAANRGSNCSFARAMDGRIVHCGIISSCQSAATSKIVKRFWSCVRSAIASTWTLPLPLTAATAVARRSHRNSVRPSVTRVNQSKTVQAWITKSSPSAAWKTLVSGSVKLFHQFEGCRLERRR